MIDLYGRNQTLSPKKVHVFLKIYKIYVIFLGRLLFFHFKNWSIMLYFDKTM